MIAKPLTRAQEDALLAFDPVFPAMWGMAKKRPSYNLLCQLRRRGLALCDPPAPQHRANFRHSWRMTGAGERERARLAQLREVR